VQTARADASGRYEFRGVKPGRYYVFTGYRVFDNEVYWMVPVEIKSGKQTLDLSNANTDWPF
jgi:hypothetical protein